MGTERRRRDAEFYATRTAWHWGEGMCGSAGGWVYAVQEDRTPLVKIGLSIHHDVQPRVKALPGQFGVSLTLVGTVYIAQWAAKVERYLPWMLRSSRIQGEWFYLYMNQATLDRLTAQAISAVRQHEQCEQAKHAHALRRIAAKRRQEGWTC
jgi:hypothetical protein